MKNRASN